MHASVANSTVHTPVLLAEVQAAFADMTPSLMFDGTLGGGGHAEALLSQFPQASLVGFDRDAVAISRCKERLRDYSDRIWLTQSSFAQLSQVFSDLPDDAPSALKDLSSPLQFDCMLLDLGISSDQLDLDSRGFSFHASGPLDMRMDQNAGRTAADILNQATQGELVKIFRTGGLNDLTTVLAKEVIASRPLTTTKQFAEVCIRALRSGKLQRRAKAGQHPATVPFQALRIAVNAEFEAIEEFLEDVLQFLAPTGRLAIISFHSLEDKLVARTLRGWARTEPGARKLPSPVPAKGALLTKKAILPSSEEIELNPRARSARLRVFEKSAVETAKR